MQQQKAIADFEAIKEKLDDEFDNSPFDNLQFGGVDWMQFGDTEPLRMLFGLAIEKLKTAAEE